MQTRFEERAPARCDRVAASPLPPARHETPRERVREIRRRIDADAYRSADVAEAIARRILLSREL